VRVLDCECGNTVQAANDEELREALAHHLSEHDPAHREKQPNDEQLRTLVAQRAYDATDS
jgi:hypothetical protein